MAGPRAEFLPLLILVLVSFLQLCEAAEDAVVRVEQGLLRGHEAITDTGRRYRRFLGVPFAKPPLGNLRFKEPQPASNWTGVLDAFTDGPPCPQKGNGTEDCLYLNIFTPARGAGLLPVMFYVFGGVFYYSSPNSTMYAPDHLIEYDVVLVSCSYRLGTIGFLSLETEQIPGNVALKDTIAGLQWVQRNIASFGGDPATVTIFGHSSGAMMVSRLYLSPTASGLFHRTIIQSGLGLSGSHSDAVPRRRAELLATAAGFRSRNLGELTRFYQQASARSLTVAQDQLLKRIGIFNVDGTMEPVVETAGSHRVVLEPPACSLLSGRFNRVPLLFGCTSADGITHNLYPITDEVEMARWRENFTELIDPDLSLPTKEQRTRVALKVQDYYFGPRGFNGDDPQAVVNMLTDLRYLSLADFFASEVSVRSTEAVYLYYFAVNGSTTGPYGVPHTGELPFLFPGFEPRITKDPTSRDFKIRQLMSMMWTNFAKFGNPAPNGSPVRWDRFNTKSRSYLHMAEKFETRRDLLHKRLGFWRDNVPIVCSQRRDRHARRRRVSGTFV